ncbi:MAG: PP2C family protein-serine/threonine phosphatase [Acidimicrobiales bacterium]
MNDRDDREAFVSRYGTALASYVAVPDEPGRAEAYALGRIAVEVGMSLLDLMVVHQDSTASLFTEIPADEGAGKAASQFCLEAIATFDMAQRGYWEAQERARSERDHAEQLARLNDAVVSMSSVPDLVEGLVVTAEHGKMLVGAVQSYLYVDDVELVSPQASPDVLAELRALAGKAQASGRNQRPSTTSSKAGGWMLAVPVGSSLLPPRGALVVSRATPFSEEEVAIIEQFTRYASMALDMAVRREQDHAMAVTLQHALLPRAIPQVRGLHIAWRYLPAEGRDIGGDWYDVFNLENGEVAVVIGDVMGHDLQAAAMMGQLRLALQAYAIDGYPPSEVVDRADRLLQLVDPTRLATLAYIVIDPERHRLRLTNAGHPPPLLQSPDGNVTMLTGGLSVPLGTDAEHARHCETEYPILPGTRILLYTDGLVEARRRDIGHGIDRLIHVMESESGTPDSLCDAVLSVRTAAREDDVCILCAVVDPLVLD